MKEEKTRFSERLRAAMRQANLDVSATVLEKKFNARFGGTSVSSQAASQWLNGKAIPRLDKLRVLAEVLDVELAYLRDGDKGVRGVRDNKANWPEAVGNQDRSAFEAFLALPTAQRKLVRELILALGEAAKSKNR
jgi:transcriptional regulator with XRE-family HTH domain